MSARHSHPSGRPIRLVKNVQLPFYRIPHNEPLTPGLRRSGGVLAIGFTANLVADDDYFDPQDQKN